MLLEARNLHVGYGDATAIWDASLDVDGGEIVSVIGPTGAGKTTLINALAGMLRCRDGKLRFDGADMTRVRDEGVAVLLVEQNVLKALEVADRAYVLEQGRIVSSGLPGELLAQPHIREAYLGV